MSSVHPVTDWLQPLRQERRRVALVRCGGCGALRDLPDLVTYDAARELEVSLRIRLCTSCRGAR